MEQKDIDQLIVNLRQIAGKIGATRDELADAADHENYDYQVQTGLAEAVVEILDSDPGILVHWFGYCFIELGLESNERINALLDALGTEVYTQLADRDEKEGGRE